MALRDADLLAAVEQSPRAAAAHDRAGWVGLFTPDGRIEDPVGSRPHTGHVQISRFYDTFIGPRDITFHRDLDIVRGHAVIRDLGLEVAMSSVTMTIPAFLRYDLRALGDGEFKVAELRAYWDLPAMMLGFLRNGASAAPAALALSGALVRNQRLLGTAGFAAGFRRPGSRSKRLVSTFLSAVARADKAGAAHTLSPGAAITLGDDDVVDIGQLAVRLEGGRWTKVIGAGSTIAVSTVTGQERAVVFADLARGGRQITRIRYFPA